MSFLNPLALLAMAAVAVPLFVHFFNLRQPQTVDFSSLEFVEAVQETAVQRVRIQEWLLLLLRMLAIACLVLAFARPTLTGAWSGVAPAVRTVHGLVVDNSLSMGTDAEAGGSALDAARRQAGDVLDGAGENDDLLVWPTAQTGTGRPQPSDNVDAARQRMNRLSPQSGAPSLARSIVQASQSVAAVDAPRRVVHVASDLRGRTLGDSVATAVPEGVQVQLRPVAARTPTNVGIADVTVVSRIVEPGQPVQIEATLVNYGTERLVDYVSSVYLAGNRVAQTTATLEPGLETTVSFTVTPQARGWLEGAVAVEGDGFPADDRHHFTLHVPQERRVLAVRGAGQSTRFVDLALSSEMIEDRIAFRTTRIEEAALPTTDLGRYDAVLLVGPRTLSDGTVDALVRYVERGGGVMLFPGSEAEAADYDALLAGLGAGRVEGFVGTAGGEQSVASFERVDLGHPLFEGVFSRRQRAGEARVERPDIYRALRIRPSGAAGQTLIELSTGTPFLHEVRHGSGLALISAVAPTLQWSDLPTRGLFVPLLYRSIYYLSSGTAVAGEQLVAGRPAELRVPGVPPDATVRLRGPEGVEVAPDRRALFGATLLRVGRELDVPGVYDVVVDGTVVRRFAVNVDPAESDLRTVSPDSAAAHLQSVLNTPVQTPQTANPDEYEAVPARGAGTEIWNVFLLLALLFLLSEMWVANRWTPSSAAA